MLLLKPSPIFFSKWNGELSSNDITIQEIVLNDNIIVAGSYIVWCNIIPHGILYTYWKQEYFSFPYRVL
jgi:hypothetical protein